MNNKTRPGHTTDVKKYLASLDNAKRRSDAEAVLELMQEITGKSCLYISKLEDINVRVLDQLIRKSVADMRKNYDCQ